MNSRPSCKTRHRTLPRTRIPSITVVVTALLLAHASLHAEVTNNKQTPLINAIRDPASHQIEITAGNKPVLRYNYQQIEPDAELLEQVHPDSRKYARARSNYIHPLYGPDGEILTADFSPDHPHHRGIYWAWPEVDYGDQRGDLHALQHVFARPTGNISLRSGDIAEINAENLWKWEDKIPIVREQTSIRVSHAGKHSWYVDLKFEFTPLVDEVTLARRGTELYGGLNTRLSPVENLKLLHHADPADSQPRKAWSDSVGIRTGGEGSVGLAIFEKASNPHYPGDWIVYEKLPWFQPAFPAKGVRFTLDKDNPLILEYRLWIRPGGQATDQQYRAQWDAYNTTIDNN